MLARLNVMLLDTRLHSNKERHKQKVVAGGANSTVCGGVTCLNAAVGSVAS